MAERRMLWKSISLSKKVNSVSLQSALLFTWTIPHMDRDGFIEADPEYLKMAVVPRRKEIPEKTISKLIAELVDIGLWDLYQDGKGKKYVKDPRWTEFQTLTKSREAESKISQLNPKLINDSLSPHQPLTESSPTTHLEGKGREEKGREGKVSLMHTARMILDGYPRIFSEEQTLKNIISTLNKKVNPEILIQARDNYRAEVERNNTESRFIFKSTNFFGQHAEWQNYVNPEMGEDEKALRDFERFQKEAGTKKDLGKTGNNQGA